MGGKRRKREAEDRLVWREMEGGEREKERCEKGSYSSGGREGSADFSEDENLPLPHGLFSSLFFFFLFFLLTSCSLRFNFHSIPCGSSRNGWLCVYV